jgi:hypothetical protein
MTATAAWLVGVYAVAGGGLYLAGLVAIEVVWQAMWRRKRERAIDNPETTVIIESK